ncbi:MAG: cobalamin-binding protein [Ruminococcaceae bacterium]|nr:cobalamin-binding protein [Oscillospiraceae bacterium]
MSKLEQIQETLLRGREKPLVQLVQEAMDEGTAPEAILDEGLVPAMSKLGEQYNEGKVFVTELMRSAKAFNSVLALIAPKLAEGEHKDVGTVVIGTVFGDKHDIGKNLVGIMLRGAGFKVIDLGCEVSAEAFADAVEENNADVVALSALLTTTMKYQTEVIETLAGRGLRDRVKVMVGGAPVTEEFARSIGADAYAENAAAAAKRALELVGA